MKDRWWIILELPVHHGRAVLAGRHTEPWACLETTTGRSQETHEFAETVAADSAGTAFEV